MKKITIIGGGASGTLLAVNLLLNAGEKPLEVNLIERRGRLGRGVAFGTEIETHLLNVPAAKMGGFPDDVEHFYRWLCANDYDFEPDSFVPRRIFGRYLGELLRDSQNGSSPPTAHLKIIDDEAIDLVEGDGRLTVRLASGPEVVSDAAALAFGNFPPPQPSVADLAFTASPSYFRDPWSGTMYERIGRNDSIFIIGTGLSMVDLAMHFRAAGHQGKIFAISTRGLLPAVHELGSTYPSFYDEIKPMREITQILKAVRRHIAAAESDGSSWRAVIDSLRPATQQIWLDLPLAEKKYFRQHLSRYWNVARHRMPAEAASVIDEMRGSGRLEILKGRITQIDPVSQGFDIKFTTDGIASHRTADTLVNCIGSESNFANIDSPLIQNLLARGTIRNDELSLGLDATADGAMIGTDDKPSDRIYSLGTALKGILWESTAIPEIRTQARNLALKLLAA